MPAHRLGPFSSTSTPIANSGVLVRAAALESLGGTRQSTAIRRLGPVVLAIVLGAAATVHILYALNLRYIAYRVFAFDLGLLAQASWKTLRGAPFATTILPFSYLTEHLSPVLAPLSLLFLVWPDVRVLLVVQAIAVGVAGLGLYVAAARRTGNRGAALLIQAAFYLAPVTGWVAWDEFHPLTLVMAPMAFATALLWSGRPRWALAVASLALLAHEEVTLWLAPFALLVAIIGGRKARVPGIAVALGAIAWLAAYMLVLVPAIRPTELGTAVPHPNIGAFVTCGRTLGEIADCLVLDPLATLQRMTTSGDGYALWLAFAPTAGLGLLGLSSLVALPRWLTMLLGNDPPAIWAHYATIPIMAAYLGVAEASAWLARTLRISVRVIASAVAACSLAGFLLASPLPGGGRFDAPTAEQLARAALLDRAVALTAGDPDASIVATSSLVPRFALRDQIYLLLDPPEGRPEYRVLDLRDPYPLGADSLRDRAAFLRADPSYTTLLDDDGVLVQELGGDPPVIALAAQFGAVTELYGANLDAAGDDLEVDLYWRTVGAAKIPYHYFVHLVDSNGNLIDQQDGELVDGRLPATDWEPGTKLRQTIDFDIPPVSAGLELRIGWYDPGSGQRLRLPDGRDHVTIPVRLAVWG